MVLLSRQKHILTDGYTIKMWFISDLGLTLYARFMLLLLSCSAVVVFVVVFCLFFVVVVFCVCIIVCFVVC